MSKLTRFLVLSFCAMATCEVAIAAPTFSKEGVVKIPAEDFATAEGKTTAKFKATRWGMYDVWLEGVAGGDVKATVNGGKPVRAGNLEVGLLGTYYLQKAGPCVIALEGKVGRVTALRFTPACEGTPVVQEKGKLIELDAKDSQVSGVMLRYEPNPKKLCLGFWGNPADFPIWNFTVTTPGKYEVVLTQGCGKGAGGSVAVLETAGSELEFIVKDTGGWQNWVDRSLGKVTFEKAGPQELTVKVRKKARGIMDIRRIVLKPVKD